MTARLPDTSRRIKTLSVAAAHVLGYITRHPNGSLAKRIAAAKAERS